MSHMANKFKTMNMPLPDPFVIQLVFKSIPKDFLTFHVNYNTQPGNRNVEKLFTMCCQKVDRLKAANGDELVFHVQQKNKNYQNNKKLFLPSTNQMEYDKMPPHMRMLLRNANELMQSRRNYGTVV